MGAYLDRLHGEFDEITNGISAVVERAADESRDLTGEENTQVERDDKRRDDLLKAIEHHTALEERTAKVAQARGRVQLAPTRVQVREREPEYDLAREFPTAADYACTLHRALVKKDPEAVAAIERATTHQTTAENPGIIPKPVVGPLINTMSGTRPLVSSLGTRPAPAGKFTRPRIDQHVDVGVQGAEKDLTASQPMLISGVDVTLATFAGHLNISKQDIRWSQPSILQVVFDDFSRIYARRTDAAACADFATAAPDGPALASYAPAAVEAWLRDAFGTVMAATDGAIIDTLWMSLDVWGGLGGSVNAQGVKAFNLPLTGGGGDVLGLRPVLDPQLADSTLIVGDSALAEFWEDLEGFLSVDEPDVLGQLVGYAGYAKLAVVEPNGFLQATGLPIPTAGGASAPTESGATESSSGSSSSSSTK